MNNDINALAQKGIGLAVLLKAKNTLEDTLAANLILEITTTMLQTEGKLLDLMIRTKMTKCPKCWRFVPMEEVDRAGECALCEQERTDASIEYHSLGETS